MLWEIGIAGIAQEKEAVCVDTKSLLEVRGIAARQNTQMQCVPEKLKRGGEILLPFGSTGMT